MSISDNAKLTALVVVWALWRHYTLRMSGCVDSPCCTTCLGESKVRAYIYIYMYGLDDRRQDLEKFPFSIFKIINKTHTQLFFNYQKLTGFEEGKSTISSESYDWLRMVGAITHTIKFFKTFKIHSLNTLFNITLPYTPPHSPVMWLLQHNIC